MNINVTVDDGQIEQMVKRRIAELFADDARFSDTPARRFVNQIVDETAANAIKQARDAIVDKLPELATAALTEAMQREMAKAANRGLKMMGKLFAGFDPKNLTPEQRDWLSKQISKAGEK